MHLKTILEFQNIFLLPYNLCGELAKLNKTLKQSFNFSISICVANFIIGQSGAPSPFKWPTGQKSNVKTLKTKLWENPPKTRIQNIFLTEQCKGKYLLSPTPHLRDHSGQMINSKLRCCTCFSHRHISGLIHSTELQITTKSFITQVICMFVFDYLPKWRKKTKYSGHLYANDIYMAHVLGPLHLIWWIEAKNKPSTH